MATPVPTGSASPTDIDHFWRMARMRPEAAEDRGRRHLRKGNGADDCEVGIFLYSVIQSGACISLSLTAY